MTETARAVLYARVSSQEQAAGYSLPTQLEAMRRYCAERGYTVVGEYEDAHSGTELDRPGINRLLEEGRTLRPDVVVLYDVDRLGRELIVQAVLERDLQALGARVEYVLGGNTDSADGELLKVLKQGLAVYENRQRVERSRRGKRGRALAGHVVVSRPPFGYGYVSLPHGGSLTVNEEEAVAVRLMFDWLIDERLSTYAITQRLWDRQIPHRGGKVDWTPPMVQKLLRNPVYAGRWAFGRTRRTKVNGAVRHVPVPEDQWVWVAVPPIVSPERWEEAQRVLDENRALARRNAKRDYLLSGLVYCTCGWRRVGKVNGGIAYYVCHRSATRSPWFPRCERRGVRQDALEAAVWTFVIDQLLDPDLLGAEVERQRAEQASDAARRERRVREVETELAEVDRRLGALLMQELDGYPASVIEQQKHALLARRAEADAQLTRLHAEQASQDITPDVVAQVMELAATVREAAPHMAFDERRKLLRLLRIRVELLDEHHAVISGLLRGSIVHVSSR